MKLIVSMIVIAVTSLTIVNKSLAETQTVCAGSMPAGWLRTDDRWEPARCGNPTGFASNVWIIERYDNKPAGSVITACMDSVPKGWSIIAQKWDPARCGKPSTFTDNVMTIKRLNDPPRAASETPRGIVFVAPARDFAARVKAGKHVLASREGQEYESSWGEAIQTILTTCVPAGSTDTVNIGRFTFAADVSPAGEVSSVEVDPSTDVSRCFSLHFGKAKLPSPPTSLIKGDRITVSDDINVVP